MDHGVLEAVTTLAPLNGRGLEHEVGGDELIHRVGDAVATGLTQHAVPEARSDHRGHLDALARGRRKTVDARRDDGVQRRGYFEGGGTLAKMPLAARVISGRP